jgi:mono/diheme cytochrome c family protein
VNRTPRKRKAPALLAALALCACHKGAAPPDALGNGAPPTDLHICPPLPSGDAGPAQGSGDGGDGGALVCPNVCGDLQVQGNWNAADAGVGNVQAVVDLSDEQVIFSDQGATVFQGGVAATVDATTTAWSGAGPLPATDGRGLWPVGIGTDGQLSRVTGSGLLERVSDRFGLLSDDVTGIASGGSSGDGGPEVAGFLVATDGGVRLAISNGTSLQRYDESPSALAGGAGKIAWLEGSAVKRLDPVSGTLEEWQLPGATALAVSAGGRLVAATAHALYAEAQTVNLNEVYRTQGTLHALTASGERFWFAADQRLGYLEATAVNRTTGAVVADGTRLFPASGGGVWGVSSGSATRYAAGGEEVVWEQLVLPTFARVCSQCHLPGGTSGIPMASLDAWKAEKDNIVKRVLVGLPDKPMPPKGTPILPTPAELDLIRCWVGTLQ